jgi:hypothetical protein
VSAAKAGSEPLTLVAGSAADASLWSDLVSTFAGVGRERPWFAEGAIEGAPLIMFSGPEKSHKSWTGMQLAVATVTGGAWLGRFPIRKPGRVVYLDGEYGEHEFTRRVVRIARGMGAHPREVLAAIRHHYSVDLVLLPSDATFRRVLAAVRAEPPSLIVLDPLRNHLDGSENDSDAVVRAYRCLDALRVAGCCPVLSIHHLNKSGGFSGSRAITTRADLIIEGSDAETPTYSVRGRTVRPTVDAIARPFSIAISHEHDGDDAIAATRLVWAPAEHDAGRGGGEATCTQEQKAKVRTYIEANYSSGDALIAADVLAGMREAGAGVAKGAFYAAMRALARDGFLTDRPDTVDPETGKNRKGGWDVA